MSFSMCIYATIINYTVLFQYINISIFSTETGALHISQTMPVYKTGADYTQSVGISCKLQYRILVKTALLYINYNLLRNIHTKKSASLKNRNMK
jgi:hypothetical protein